MLTIYIQQALRNAKYQLMEDGRIFGEIPVCPGTWAEGASLEQCREELQSVLEDWILVKARHGDRFPIIDGVDINPKPEYAETD